MTVVDIRGDYALLCTDDAEENLVALALLPDGVDAGDRLRWADFSYERL